MLKATDSDEFRWGLKVGAAWTCNNYVRIQRLARQAPSWLAAGLLCLSDACRGRALAAVHEAYSCPNACYPLAALQRMLNVNSCKLCRPIFRTQPCHTTTETAGTLFCFVGEEASRLCAALGMHVEKDIVQPRKKDRHACGPNELRRLGREEFFMGSPD